MNMALELLCPSNCQDMTFSIRYNMWSMTCRGTYCEICANKSGNAEFASLQVQRVFLYPVLSFTPAGSRYIGERGCVIPYFNYKDYKEENII